MFFLSLALNHWGKIGLLWFDLLGILLSFSETQVKVLVRYSGGSHLYSQVGKFSLMIWSPWNRLDWWSVKHLQAFNKHLDKGDELDTPVICKACMCPQYAPGSLPAPQPLRPKTWQKHCAVHFQYTHLSFFSAPKLDLGRGNRTVVTQISSRQESGCFFMYLTEFHPGKESGCYWNTLSDVKVCKILSFRHKCSKWGFLEVICQDFSLNNLETIMSGNTR